MNFLHHKKWYWLRDCVFPLPEPLTPQELEDNRLRRAEEKRAWENRVAVVIPERAGEVYAACLSALEQERQRRQSTEGRLTTMVGLSSIAGTIVFGTLLANTQRSNGLVDWLILACVLYLVLQIASAILAGIRGLERRSYPSPSTTELLVAADETPSHHARRRLLEFLEILVEHQERNNNKVTQMDVAHRATKNFIAGLLVLSLLAAFSRISARPSQDLMDRLTNDAAFRKAFSETIRGPQGPVGPPGPPGPPGQACSPEPNPQATANIDSKQATSSSKQ